MSITLNVLSLKKWIIWSSTFNGFNKMRLRGLWNVFRNKPYLHTKDQTL